MATANDSPPNDRLIRRTEARKHYLGGISAATEWRRLKSGDPQFPRLSADGLHYRLSDLQKYISLIGAPRTAPRPAEATG